VAQDEGPEFKPQYCKKKKKKKGKEKKEITARRIKLGIKRTLRLVKYGYILPMD
jgi:hypothetical protein